jgi:predicted RecB family nuclease
VPIDGQHKSLQLVPVRFVFTSKLNKDDKLLLAFDAAVLSELLNPEVSSGTIIHGTHHVVLEIDRSHLVAEVRKRIAEMESLLSNPEPPALVLNRHCAECEFQARCRQQATANDDLSLLQGMSEKERERHCSKGIFTVSQLSYTFRPKRTPKRAKRPAKPALTRAFGQCISAFTTAVRASEVRSAGCNASA